MSAFHKVVLSTSVPDGTMKLVSVDEKPVMVIRAGSKLVALEEMCPHRGAPLSEGTLEGTRLTCPWHQASFDIETGEPLGGPVHRALKRYEVKEEDGWIWVLAGQ